MGLGVTLLHRSADVTARMVEQSWQMQSRDVHPWQDEGSSPLRASTALEAAQHVQTQSDCVDVLDCVALQSSKQETRGLQLQFGTQGMPACCSKPTSAGFQGSGTRWGGGGGGGGGGAVKAAQWADWMLYPAMSDAAGPEGCRQHVLGPYFSVTLYVSWGPPPGCGFLRVAAFSEGHCNCSVLREAP